MKQPVHIQEVVEIQAPAEEVFAILVDPLKHLQLGPSWGQAKLDQVSDDYPQPGSTFQLTPAEDDGPPYLTTVTALEPGRRIAIQAENESRYNACWEIETLDGSVRLSYLADFTLEIVSQAPEDTPQAHTDELVSAFNQPETFERKAEIARREAVEWLTSIKRYAELRETRLRLWLRRMMDRYVLRLRSDQRRIILALLAMQLITCLTFIAAVVGIGLASLIF
jgi:hypothetical protein